MNYIAIIVGSIIGLSQIISILLGHRLVYRFTEQ